MQLYGENARYYVLSILPIALFFAFSLVLSSSTGCLEDIWRAWGDSIRSFFVGESTFLPPHQAMRADDHMDGGFGKNKTHTCHVQENGQAASVTMHCATKLVDAPVAVGDTGDCR